MAGPCRRHTRLGNDTCNIDRGHLESWDDDDKGPQAYPLDCGNKISHDDNLLSQVERDTEAKAIELVTLVADAHGLLVHVSTFITGQQSHCLLLVEPSFQYFS
jgi:hypothetical protein